MSVKVLNVPAHHPPGAGGGRGLGRVIPVPLATIEDPPTCCFMPRIRALILGLSVLLLLGAVSLGLQIASYSRLRARFHAHLVRPADFALWSKGYFGILAIHASQLVIDGLALAALIAKKHRKLLLLWIAWNAIVFVMFIISLVLIPLAVLWYFWIKNTWNVYESKFVKS